MMEAAIGWLVQTTLATLRIDKLEEWIRRVGLADDIEKLKSEIRRAGMVVSAVKGREIGNEPLAESLALLKELLYDADGVVDDLDYYRLQQQVEFEGVVADDPEGVHAAEQVDDTSRGDADILNTSGKSEAWQHFKITVRENAKPVRAECKYCLTKIKCGTVNWTSDMRNHLKICKEKPGASDQPPNPSSTGDANPSSRKRRRTDESAQVTAANTHTPCDKAELSNRIKKIISQLQDIRGEVSEVLKLHGSDSATNANHDGSTTSDQYLRTSSLVPREVYGRVAEKKSIIKLMTENKSDGVTVLPIVGIAGIGKTALAQLVYNDPDVESQFDHRIWVWVSHDFDELRLIREMLDFVSRERHEGSPQKVERYEGISSFAKLQEILKGHMEFLSKRFLLIFDDVWDNMDDYQWNKLLAPLKSSRAKGNVILVTTRSFSVAQRTGTVKSIKLGALANKDYFWSLFKAYAFGDGNYEGHEILSIVGRQIAEKLEGNSLAAETAGALLREHLTIDHWSSILVNEDWKSLQLSRGIMPALKLSYDQLPYHLQQCFSCCSIFPYGYQFLGDDLVHMWISQGFVKRNHSSKRLEEIGQYYLTDLVNLGFFQQVEEGKKEEEFSVRSQIWYAMCGLMHDFARMVSRSECATIDGRQCNKMLPTIQHLSILTYSAYRKDQHGNIPRSKKFEAKLRNTVTSVRKLRTLVLIGQYDSFFFRLFQDIFQKAQNLRLLQLSATSADFNSFMCSLVNTTHLRYLKRESDEKDGALSQVLSKFCHLQVLDVGSNTDPTVPNGMNNLVNLRHLIADKGVYSSIASIGSMTSLQELHDFKVQSSSCFEITQLQCMNELVQLEMSQLDNVKTPEEAYGAGLRNKEHLGKLHLSWKDTLSEDEYVGDTSFESSADKGEELSRMDDSGPNSEPSMDTPREVLEGLEPNLKHLQISGYNADLFNASCDLTSSHVEAAVEYIVSLCLNVVAEIVVFKSEDVTLLAKHMKCLTPGATEFQDCELINAYAEHLSTPIGPDRPARVGSHRLLYSTWRTELLTRERNISNNPSAQKIEALLRCVKEYFDCDMVLFPVNVHDSHWIVAAMDTKRQEIQILDSLWSLHMYKEKIERLLNGIEADVSVSRKHLDPLLPDVTSWPIRQIQNIPKQTDAHSCGLFVLKYMEHWDGTRLRIDFTQRDVYISSKKMVAELIFSHANQDEDVKEEVRKIMCKTDIPT